MSVLLTQYMKDKIYAQWEWVAPGSFHNYKETMMHYHENFLAVEEGINYAWYSRLQVELVSLAVVADTRPLIFDDFSAINALLTWYSENVVIEGVSELWETNLNKFKPYVMPMPDIQPAPANTITQYIFVIYDPLTDNPNDIAYVGMSQKPWDAVQRLVYGITANEEVVEFREALLNHSKHGWYVMGEESISYYITKMTRQEIMQQVLAKKRGSQQVLEWGIVDAMILDKGQKVQRTLLYDYITKYTNAGHWVRNKKAGRKALP